MPYERGCLDEEVVSYVKRYLLVTGEEASKTLEFIRGPLWRLYGFNCAVGRDLVKGLIRRGGRAHGWFCRLLEEPVNPALVLQWTTESGG